MDSSIRVWHMNTGKEINRLPALERFASGRAIGFTPDGRRLLSWADNCSLRIWDAATGKALRRYSIPSVPTGKSDIEIQRIRESLVSMGPVCFSPDGRQIASSGKNGTVYIYTFNNLKKDFTLSALTLLKYLTHQKKQNTLDQLPPKPLYLEAFAQLPKVFRLRFLELFNYDELAKKLKARKHK